MKFMPPPRKTPSSVDPRQVERFIAGQAPSPTPPEAIAAGPAKRKRIVGGRIAYERVRGSGVRQDQQFVIRFTREERRALDAAFEKSAYRFLHQYVRSLILPAIGLREDSGDP